MEIYEYMALLKKQYLYKHYATQYKYDKGRKWLFKYNWVQKCKHGDKKENTARIEGESIREVREVYPSRSPHSLDCQPTTIQMVVVDQRAKGSKL